MPRPNYSTDRYELPPDDFSIRAVIDTCPERGGHQWIFVAAMKLHRLGVTPEEIARHLYETGQQVHYREFTMREIEDAVNNAEGVVSGTARAAARRRVPVSPFNFDAAQELVAERWEVLSSWREDRLVPEDTAEALSFVFDPGDLVCHSVPGGVRSLLREFDLSSCSRMRHSKYVVPNPMRGDQVSQKNDHRCNANVLVRRYQVIEFDFPNEDFKQWLLDQRISSQEACAALISVLMECVQVDLVVDSGNKSLHAWIPMHNFPDEEGHREFFAACTSLGADPAMWPPCQWTRMPWGLADNQPVVWVRYE